MGHKAITYCCRFFYRACKLNLFIPVLNKATGKVILAMPGGTENKYDKVNEVFIEQPIMLGIICCPFCKDDIVVKDMTDEEVKANEDLFVSDNTNFGTDDEGEEWKKGLI